MAVVRAQRKIPVDLHFIVRLRHKASGAALGLSCAVCFEQPAGVSNRGDAYQQTYVTAEHRVFPLPGQADWTFQVII